MLSLELLDQNRVDNLGDHLCLLCTFLGDFTFQHQDLVLKIALDQVCVVAACLHLEHFVVMLQALGFVLGCQGLGIFEVLEKLFVLGSGGFMV